MMKTNPKFAFFGTPIGSVYVLDVLKEHGFLPVLIVTLPDAPVGRKAILSESEVTSWAKENRVECVKPKSLKEFTLPEDLDFSLVAAYGKIIPLSILNAPREGTFNIHPSRLPSYRGPTPIQTAILNGNETCVTIMKLDELEDHGPIVAQSDHIEISDKNYLGLEKELFEIGTSLFIGNIKKIVEGKYKSTEQDHGKATYTKKFKSEDAFIEPDLIITGSEEKALANAERKVRALNPEPGAWSVIKTNKGEIRIRILSAKIECGKLTPKRVIPAGKKEMVWDDFLRGNRI